jgi:hypothetical protein
MKKAEGKISECEHNPNQRSQVSSEHSVVGQYTARLPQLCNAIRSKRRCDVAARRIVVSVLPAKSFEMALRIPTERNGVNVETFQYN